MEYSAQTNRNTPNDTRIVVVIIPACNEATVIRRCLDCIDAQDFRGKLNVFVVVNGTTDETAEIARQSIALFEKEPNQPRSFSVIEINERSKVDALNAGDEISPAADLYVYLDADIQISSNAIRLMANSIVGLPATLIQPLRCSAPIASTISRIAGSALCGLPWVKDDVICGGIYAVNAAGRTLWGKFPHVAADDAFVFHHFRSTERKVILGCWATHPMPESLRGVIRQQHRWRQANQELHRSGIEFAHSLDRNQRWPIRRRLFALLKSPKAILCFFIIRALRTASLFDYTKFSSHSWCPDRRCPSRTKDQGGLPADSK